MKKKSIILFALVLGAAIGCADDETPPGEVVNDEGIPPFEWTSGNFFDFSLIELGFTPIDLDVDGGLDYWSGYHHLSYPITKDSEFYIGFAWGVVNFFAELGLGFQIRTYDPLMNWEPHITAFVGPDFGFCNSSTIFGVRRAIKYQITTGEEGRAHFFAGIGLTIIVDAGAMSSSRFHLNPA